MLPELQRSKETVRWWALVAFRHRSLIVEKKQNRIESVTGPEVKQKYKFEVDALRARFKMMHSTGAFFDRSPSTSESEQNAEVSSGRLL